MQITNLLCSYTELNGYIIDNINGWVPAVQYSDTRGEVLIVVPKALDFSMVDKKVTWWVEEYVWNTISQKWVLSTTGKFQTENGISKLAVTNTTLLDSTNGTYTDSNNPNAIGEADFYINALGKPAIYPAIYAAVSRKLNN